MTVSSLVLNSYTHHRYGIRLFNFQGSLIVIRATRGGGRGVPRARVSPPRRRHRATRNRRLLQR